MRWQPRGNREAIGGNREGIGRESGGDQEAIGRRKAHSSPPRAKRDRVGPKRCRCSPTATPQSEAAR